MKSFTTVLGIVAFAVTPSVKAWAIGWWESTDCSASNGPWSFYTGTGNNVISMSSCLIPGQPGLDTEPCQWRQSSTSDASSCTTALNPAARSFYIPSGTNCCKYRVIKFPVHKKIAEIPHDIGVYSECGNDLHFLSDKVDQCIDVSSIQYWEEDKPIYFSCFDQI